MRPNLPLGHFNATNEKSPQRAPSAEQCLWARLQQRLDEWNPTWRDQLGAAASTERLARRRSGNPFYDDEIFEGLLLAVLSGNTRWSTVERIHRELAEPFQDFSLAAYVQRSESDIAGLVSWFPKRKAGSTGLRAGLLRLRDTAALLDRYSRERGSADAFFGDALIDAGGEPEDLALAIGSAKQ